RRHVDSLQEVGASLGQEDDRLGRLDLSEEQRLLASVAAPLVDEIQRRPARARIPGLAPLGQSVPNQVDELELLPVAASGFSELRLSGARIPKEVTGSP